MKLKQIFSLQSLDRTLRTVRASFPITVVSLLVALFISTVLIHGSEFDYLVETWVSILFTSLFSALVFANIEYLNALKGNLIRHSLLLVAGLAAGALFYIGLPNLLEEPSIEFVVALMMLFSTLAISLVSLDSYVSREENVETLSKISANILAIVQAVIVATLTMIFVFIVFGTLDVLFNVRISGEWYLQVATFCWLTLFSIFFLSRLISIESFDVSKRSFFKLLTRFVFIPFVSFYALVLLAYSLRALFILREWPTGVFPWLILGFCVSGLITYLCAQYIERSDYTFLFTKVYPWLTLPLLGMLFYAIVVRIDVYGWTINRYLVLALGVWFTVVALYLLIKKGTALYVVPASLVTISLVMMIGPWSIFTLPETSQQERLETILSEITTFENGLPVPLSDEQVDTHSKRLPEVRSIINYLCDYHGCPEVRDWIESLGIDASTPRGNTNQYLLLDYLNIEPYENYLFDGDRRYFYYSMFLEGVTLDVLTESRVSFIGENSAEQLMILDGGGIAFRGEEITDLLPNSIYEEQERGPVIEDLRSRDLITVIIDENTSIKFYNLTGYTEGGRAFFTNASAVLIESL